MPLPAVRRSGLRPLFSSWGASGAVLGRFLEHLRSKSRFEAYFFEFLVDLGWILEGFWDDFSTIFCIILENCDFVKSVVLLRENHGF